MAEVYLALSGELTGFRTLVVVKRILPHLASNSEFVRMFFDEARIVAMLDHPNIVRIIEVGQDGDEYFLVMEVIQGKPLSALVRKAAKENTPLTQAQSAYLVAQAAKGLGYAHNLVDAGGRPLNVVHRDVSPQNILVSYEGAVKLIDFGVARALGRASETRPGGLKGKIQYMAPEQAALGQVDRRSDVFALGVVLWEAICGRRPFRRETDLETLRAIAEEAIPPPSRFVRISDRLESIVMRALEKNPRARFQTAQEMALALERYAFASAGFNPVQIAVTMKGLFAADFSRWKRTVAAATELEGEPEEWVNTSGTYLRPQGIDLHTRGATVALHQVPTPRPTLHTTQELTSDSRSIGSLDGNAQSDAGDLGDLADLPFLADLGKPTRAPHSKRRGGRLLALVALGVVVLAGVALLIRSNSHVGVQRSRQVIALFREAVANKTQMHVEALPPRPPAVVPAPATTEVSPPGAAPVEGENVGERSPAQAEAPGTGAVEPVAAATLPAPVPPSSDPAVRSPEPHQGSAGHSASKASLRKTAPKQRARPAPRRPTAAVAVAAPVPGGLYVGTRPDNGRGVRESVGAVGCSIRLGTQPWAEVWIDGKDTHLHTPYSDPIACGRHNLTFKRRDLGLNRTFTVVVTPGQTFKESFALEAD